MNLPGGMVRSNPGLRAMKRVVATRRSFLVRTIPIALATREYTKKNTRAWKKMVTRSVPTLLKENLRPSALRIIPGLRAKKRAAGTATLGEVTAGILGKESVGIIYCIKTFKSN